MQMNNQKSNKMFRGISVFLIFVFFVSVFPANVHGESVSDDFTGYPPSSRAEAMGGAFTSIATGAEGVFYNPAGLGFDNDFEISSSRKTLDLEQSIESTMVRFPLFKTGYSGIGYQKYGVENMAERNNAGIVIGYFDNKEEIISYSQGFSLGEKMSFGFTYFMTRHELLEANATGQGAHTGFILRDKDISLALVARNLGYRKIWRNTPTNPEEKIGREIVASVALTRKRNIFVTDFVYGEDGEKRFKGGVESRVNKKISLRAGIDDGRASYGLGYHGNSFRMDWAFSSGEFSDSYSAGITFFEKDRKIIKKSSCEKLAAKKIKKIEKVEEIKIAKISVEKKLKSKKIDVNTFYDGRRAFITKKYEDAIYLLSDYLEKNQNHGESYYLLGMSLYKSGKKEMGREILKKGIEIDPENSYARYAKIIMR